MKRKIMWIVLMALLLIVLLGTGGYQAYRFPEGKLIIPFCTSGESDIDETMPTFLNSCEGLAVHEGRRIQGAGEVDAWLEELKNN